MTTDLLLGGRFDDDVSVGAVDALLMPMKFERADPQLDRYGLRVAHEVDTSAFWWIWDPETGHSPHKFHSDFDERWRVMLDKLLELTAGRRVVHLVLGHRGNLGPMWRLGARDWDGLRKQIHYLFPPDGGIPGDNCSFQYGPDAAPSENSPVPGEPRL